MRPWIQEQEVQRGVLQRRQEKDNVQQNAHMRKLRETERKREEGRKRRHQSRCEMRLPRPRSHAPSQPPKPPQYSGAHVDALPTSMETKQKDLQEAQIIKASFITTSFLQCSERNTHLSVPPPATPTVTPGTTSQATLKLFKVRDTDWQGLEFGRGGRGGKGGTPKRFQMFVWH